MWNKADEAQLEWQSHCNYTLENLNSLKSLQSSSSSTTMTEMCLVNPNDPIAHLRSLVQSDFSYPNSISIPSVILPRSCCNSWPLSSAQCSTLHAEQIAGSLVSTCSGISANELMMQSEASVLSSQTVTSSNISNSVVICMEAEKAEFNSATKSCLSPLVSKSSCLDLQKPQSVFDSSSPILGELMQQTALLGQLPCSLPYLQVYDSHRSYPSINSSTVTPEQSQGLGHSSTDCLFSYSDVLEQISSVDGHIYPSLFQNMLFSNGDMVPSSCTQSPQLLVKDVEELQETSIKTPTTLMGGSIIDTVHSFSSDRHITGSVEHFSGNVKPCDDSAVEIMFLQNQATKSHPKMSVGFSSIGYYNGNDSETLTWQSPSSITCPNNSVDIQHISSSVIDEDSEQLFQLDLPNRSLKRGSTTDIEDDMHRYTKKSTSWSSLNSSFSTVQSKPAKANQRAKKGSATDPQSVAARNRRERISERLKNLQDLIPNGSKVDLVTMLEKAINYVKFLQLQVNVLTTDEYWPAQADGTFPNIDKVQSALEAFASNKSSPPEHVDGKLSISYTGKKMDENTENHPQPQTK